MTFPAPQPPGVAALESILLADVSPAIGVDATGVLVFANAAAAALLGPDDPPPVGQRLDELLEAVAPTDRPEVALTDPPLALAGAPAIRYGFLRAPVSSAAGQDPVAADLVAQLRRALHGSERRLEEVLEALSDAVTIRDRHHRFVYANRAALEHLGFASWEELRATSPDQVMADYIVLGEDRRPISMNDLPSVRLLQGKPAEPLVIETVHRATGQHRWDLLKSAALRDAGGEVEATLMIIEDITERRRLEQQASFLARASGVLASSLDYEQTLRNVAQLAVPGLADWCAVDLVNERGGRRTVAVAHVDPDRLKLAEELRAYEPERLDPEQGLGQLFRDGQPQLYPRIPDEMIEAAAVDARHLELLRQVGFFSAMLVPIRSGEQILGAMTLVNSESGRPLDEFDLATAQQAADRAAVAIENARLYSERSEIAQTLQRSLLPERLPEVPGFALASLYLPAVDSTEVGGDFYDVWETSDGWMLTVGDVTGKGVAAAALTGLVRHTLRVASELEASPARLLAWVDWALKKQPEMSLCTALCLRLRGDEATLAVGGHPLPLLIANGAIQPVGTNGPLLGGFTGVGWSDHTLRLGAGSTLVAYTDGVTDALGVDGTRFGQARLRDSLAGGGGRGDAADLVADLRRDLERFQPGGRADDTAVLALHRRTARSPVAVLDAA
jgi:PAS domain S-box-containing protein